MKKTYFRMRILYFVSVSFFVLIGTICAQTNLGGVGAESSLFGPAPSAQDIVKLNAQFTAPAANQPARLFITVQIKSGWHIYSITQAPGGPIPTQIKLNPLLQYRVLAKFQSFPLPKAGKEPEAFGELIVESHYGTVTWHAPLELAAGADPAKLKIDGQITVQLCDANTCLPPQQIPFLASLGPGVDLPKDQKKAVETPGRSIPAIPAPGSNQTFGSPNQSPPQVLPSGRGEKKPEKEDLTWRPFTMASFKQLVGPTFEEEILKKNIHSRLQTTGLWQEMLLGFLGGVILNLMPCVLPVIGLKILSFMEQAGEKRVHIFFLNVWYSAGLIAVFLLLAALAAFANLGWGQLFQYPAFNVTMAAVVFMMGLSFMGLWEIPIPGFIGSGKAADLAHREGFGGAFAKGVVTTILATPCTGPFMASALAWAVSQPAQNTFLVFASVGLGMASPYLIVGAFPELIHFLPKPGPWMDTLKQIMGFILMATVVYILTFLDWAYVVPAVGLLMAVWAGCWQIGRTPPSADFKTKLNAWLQAGVFVFLMSILMFHGLRDLTGGWINWGGLYDVMNSRLNESCQLKFQEYLENQRLNNNQSVNNGGAFPPPIDDGASKTIVIDFTADWCPTCKVLEATVLNSTAVLQKMKLNNVVMIKADWTHEPPEVTAMLDLLGARSVPTLAIFPAQRPNEPIIFRGGYRQQDLLKALDEADQSK